MVMNDERIIDVAGLDELFGELVRRGYTLVGPTVGEDTIVYQQISGVADLPAGIVEEQEAGFYRLHDTGGEEFFAHTTSPHSWKQFLRPPRQRLWTATRSDGDVEFEPEPLDRTKYAVIGARSCDLSAIEVLDAVLTQSSHVDPHYEQRRDAAFVIAVQCGRAGGTCFCVSMDTGPRAESGFDLALTEVTEDARHYFVVEIGSDRGEQVLGAIDDRQAKADESQRAREITDETARSMGRTMQADGLRDLLAENLEHPQWDDVAERCLSCTNCTMVCPTCFCTTTEVSTNLDGTVSEQQQRWDSCFTLDFSYVHGGSVRTSTKGRYRQWMTHKLGTWHDQFGMSGCVGCGRCITWCPVGIDITAEVAAIRATE
jgi:ferredoxin